MKIKKYADTENQFIKDLKSYFKLQTEDLWHVWNLGGLEVSRNAARTFTVSQTNKNYRRCSKENFKIFIDGLARFLSGSRYAEEE